ncbi:MAG: alcohol dehydrogenase catalytic domain-containing protein [Gammaproteobacteria bacterium]|nr:alcohol dehydrogenase catalytic domain-containing protein [Gammaproteobacteria bacterium]MDX2460621.1 alcohol dehydrogenase catalytic domain-containing protein [Gammaproteobacteria bacterium]
MKALWLSGARLRLREDVMLAQTADQEARVRVLAAGVCGTDLALVDGLYPFEGVPGHEFVGIVEEGPDALVGRRVVGEINAACGRCPECLGGLAKHCRARTALGIRGRHGAFAEYLQLPAVNLHPVPDSVSTDAAVFTEPLAAALDIVERLAPKASSRVLVVGAGKLGQLVCRVLASSGAQVVAIGRNADKLARLDGVAESTVRAEDIEPRSFSMAVECTGNPAGLPIALGALKPQGTLVLKSTYPQALNIDMGPVVVDELRLVGSRCGPFDSALTMLEEQQVDVESLIDGRFALADGVEAFAYSRSPGVLKVLLEMGVED